MSQMATEPDPILKVAQTLTAILALYDDLPEQAINDSDDTLMPGGRAMVALGPVANLEAWENKTDAGLRLGRAYTSPEDEDDDDTWPAFQIIEYWSEQWRRAAGAEYGQRPTIGTEANFIRFQLQWAWDNLDDPTWKAFTEDIARARARLEDILTAGKRSEHGVQCLSCNVDLIRYSNDPTEPHYCQGTDDGVCLLPHSRCPHDRGGLADEWKCPGCDRVYASDDYYRAVHHSYVMHADYLPLDDAAARTGAKAGTIKVWATRGKVKRFKAPGAERMTYCVADIEAARDADDTDAA